MSNQYTSSDIARTLSVNQRTARRYIEKHLYIKGNTKVLSKEFFDLIVHLESESGQQADINGQETDIDGHIEFFTEEEYQEFHKRLVEYPLFKKHIETLKSEIEHHKNQYEKLIQLHNDFVQAHKSSLKIIEQRNFIEAKEKKIND